MHLLLVYY